MSKISRAKRSRQRENRRKGIMEEKIAPKNVCGHYDLTPFNTITLINGGKVEDILLGDNHIYGSIHELGKRLPGSM